VIAPGRRDGKIGVRTPMRYVHRDPTPHRRRIGATGIAATRGDYAADWIASVTLGAAPPAACSVASFDLGVTCPLPQ
jgi:hypothetical protein